MFASAIDTISIEPADVGLRHKLETADSAPAFIQLGHTDQNFIVGDYLDLVIVGPSTFEVLPGTGGTVTSNLGTLVLQVGDRARLFMVNNLDWEMEITRLSTVEPGGDNNTFQYNNDGVFDGDARFQRTETDLDGDVVTVAVGANESGGVVSFGQDVDADPRDPANVILQNPNVGNLQIIARPSTFDSSGERTFEVLENQGRSIEMIAGYTKIETGDPDTFLIVDGCSLHLTPGGNNGNQTDINTGILSMRGGDAQIVELDSVTSQAEAGRIFAYVGYLNVATPSISQGGSLELKSGDLNIPGGGGVGATIFLEGAQGTFDGGMVFSPGPNARMFLIPDTFEDSQTQPNLVITGTGIRISEQYTPSSSSAAGSDGQLGWDTNFLHLCVDNGLPTPPSVWKFVPLLEFATKNSNSPGVKGQRAVDDDYEYICTDTDTWKRIALDAGPF